MKAAEPDGNTPLEDADLVALKPSWVSTRGELDEVEQANIIKAALWVNGRRWTTNGVLDEGALKRLHRRMYDDVWAWAGTYRQTQKKFGNLTGSNYWEIGVHMRDAVADTTIQVDTLSVGDASGADEVALRLHHRLVVIHPFPNGNGRWSRQVATLLARALKRPDFTWSGIDVQIAGGVDRTGYIDALRAADDYDFGPLIAFARS